MASREQNEQRALDIVAGRGDAAAGSPKPSKPGLGGMELTGILLWVLVLVAGAGIAAYYFLAAN